MLFAGNEHAGGESPLGGVVWCHGVRRDWRLQADILTRSRLSAAEAGGFSGPCSLLRVHARPAQGAAGTLKPEIAKDLGIVGVAGRFWDRQDVRRDHPYAAYPRYSFQVPFLPGRRRLAPAACPHRRGSGTARHYPERCEAQPHRRVRSRTTDPCEPPGTSAVEAWRRNHPLDQRRDNHLERCKIRTSLNNWPAVVEKVQGNIIADFPVINKSFNLFLLRNGSVNDVQNPPADGSAPAS